MLCNKKEYRSGRGQITAAEHEADPAKSLTPCMLLSYSAILSTQVLLPHPLPGLNSEHTWAGRMASGPPFTFSGVKQLTLKRQPTCPTCPWKNIFSPEGWPETNYHLSPLSKGKDYFGTKSDTDIVTQPVKLHNTQGLSLPTRGLYKHQSSLVQVHTLHQGATNSSSIWQQGWEIQVLLIHQFTVISQHFLR